MTTTTPELALLARVRAGDPEALGEMFTRYGAAVYSTAFHLTGSRFDAEDVVQDVFIGLPEALRSYEVRVSLSGWLRKVAARAALTRLRREQRRREDALDDEPRSDGPDQGADPIERLHVEREIARLTPGLRSVLVLKEVEGFSHAEIAELLGISASASEVRLYRAKQQLRKQLRSTR